MQTDTIAFSPGANDPVSASFGVVPARVDRGVADEDAPLTVVNRSNRTVRYELSYEPVVAQPGVSYSVSPSTLTVQGDSRARATVTMRVKPRALRHTIDPTMDKTQLDLARQYVSDASGRVLVTPRGGDAARVPVYGAAKPVSATDATVNARRIALTGPRLPAGQRQHGVHVVRVRDAAGRHVGDAAGVPARPGRRLRDLAGARRRATCSTSAPAARTTGCGSASARVRTGPRSAPR